MRVSVVIRARNRVGMLARALASVRGQTYDGYEIVVVDDASGDATRDVVAALPGPRIRLVSHARRRGPVEDANTGLRHARGGYVAFLDDDEWLPRKLERQLAALDAAPPEISWVYVWRELVEDASGRVLRSVRKTMEGDILDRILALDAPGPPSTWLVRTSALRELGGFRVPPGTGSARSSDVVVIRRLRLRGQRVAVVPEILVRKRIHAAQMTAETLSNLDRGAAFHRAHLAGFAAELAARRLLSGPPPP